MGNATFIVSFSCYNTRKKEEVRMNWLIKAFDELTTKELYQIAQARFEVFVVEQEITCENDFDDRDFDAYHLFGIEDGQVVAYARLLPRGIAYEEASMGRVLVRKASRRKGVAEKMMNRGIEFITKEWQENKIILSAQSYVVPLYEKVGFKQVSDVYDEAGIPHIKMVYTQV